MQISFLTLALVIFQAKAEFTHYDKKFLGWKKNDIASTVRIDCHNAELMQSDCPPYMCYNFKVEVGDELERFSNAVKEYKESQGFFTAIKSFFVSETLVEERKKQNAVKREIVLLGSQIKKSKEMKEGWQKRKVEDQLFDDISENVFTTRGSLVIFEDPVKQAKFVAEEEEPEEERESLTRSQVPEQLKDLPNFSLLNRISEWPLLDNEKDMIADEINEVDYILVGKHLAKLILWNGFVCYQVTDLSLVIFKFFYLKIIPRSAVKDVFFGFFEELTERALGDTPESRYIQQSLQQFYGFNLLVLLGIDSETANQLMILFSKVKAHSEIATLQTNFIELYELVLDTVNQAEDHFDNNKRQLLIRVVRFENKAVSHMLSSGTLLAVIYSVEILKSYALSPFGTYLGVIIAEHTNSLMDKLRGAIHECFPTLKTEDDDFKQYLANLIGEKANSFDMSHLDDFLPYFETAVKNQKSCAMCRVNSQINHNHVHGISKLMI